MRLITIAAAGLVILASSAAYAGNPMVGGAPMYSTKSIVQNAVNSKDHTTLVAAVKAAGLVDTLSGAGPFTVFAPTNAAFGKLPAGTVDMLVKPENKETLTRILTYHVVAGRVDSSQVAGLDSATTVNGADVAISVDGGSVRVNSSNVTAVDIEASNGLIHVIDAVLLPPIS